MLLLVGFEPNDHLSPAERERTRRRSFPPRARLALRRIYERSIAYGCERSPPVDTGVTQRIAVTTLLKWSRTGLPCCGWSNPGSGRRRLWTTSLRALSRGGRSF